MRILLAHNYYGSAAPSGENLVFELERSLLQRRGHEVSVFVRQSDELRRQGLLGAVRGALATPWNPSTSSAMRRIAAEIRPEIVHAHNTFPLISHAIFRAAGGTAARVLTLHNYRLFCAAAIPLRAGVTCTECLDRHSVIPALRHRCYRNSRLATLPLAAGITLHRLLKTWVRHVDAFIALSHFQRQLMIEAGLPAERVFVKPNFYPGAPQCVPWSSRRDAVVFAGRLSPEKGIAHLVDAWAAWGPAAPELRIIGDGPLREALEARVRQNGTGERVTFMGRLSPTAAEAEIGAARLLVLPSVWFEGFPMVLREAFALGTPSAVSAIGALPEIVRHGETGIAFTPGDPTALLRSVRALWDAPGVLGRMSKRARLEFESRYTEEANYALLSNIYDRAIVFRRQRGHA